MKVPVDQNDFRTLHIYSDPNDDKNQEGQENVSTASNNRKYDPSKKCIDEFYTIAWSFNMEKRQHVLAFGGKLGRVHVVWIPSDSFNQVEDIVLSTTDLHICEVKFHPAHAHLLLSASQDLMIHLWDINTKMNIVNFCDHRERVLSIDFNETGDHFISSSMDHNVNVWRFDTPEVLEAINTSKQPPLKVSKSDISISHIHSNYVDSVLWIGGNTFLSKASTEDNVKWWLLGSTDNEALHLNVNPIIIKEFNLINNDYWFTKMSADCGKRYVACGNRVGTVFVYDLDTADEDGRRKGDELITCTLPKNRKKRKTTKKCIAARSCSFSRDANIIVISYDDGTLAKFDVEP